MTDFLIREGAVINSTDYHGHSPLHVACQKGHQGVTVSEHIQPNIKEGALFITLLFMKTICVGVLNGLHFVREESKAVISGADPGFWKGGGVVSEW